MKKTIALLILLAIRSTTSIAGLLLDGDFNSLPLGNNPSVNAPAGSWFFPENYVMDGVAETNLTQYTIVNDPATPGLGRCLGLVADPTVQGNQHLVNLFTTAATTANGILQVDFDIYVHPGHGGGAVYLGNGSYGSRGPQLVWHSSGALVVVDANANQILITNSYPAGVWQSVRLMVNLDTDHFEFHWAVRGNPLALMAADLPFRSGQQSSLDRITAARFDIGEDVDSAFDNFTAKTFVVETPGPTIVAEPEPFIMIPPTRYWTNLYVSVTGTEPLYFQWYRDGGPIVDATNASHVAQHEWWDTFNGHSYRVAVSNAFGAVTSSWSYVVQGLSPMIYNGPEPTVVRVGSQASFSTYVIGQYVLGFASFPQPDASYQWQKDGSPLTSKTNATLVISSAQMADAGYYRLTASNQWGMVTSDPAYLKVAPAFALTISRVPPNAMAIAFPTIPGFQYITERAQDATNGDWTGIATNAGIGGIISITNQNTAMVGLFRVRVE